MHTKEFIDYISCLFGIDNNTAATLVITLSIFILGYVLTSINQFFKNYRIRENYRKLFSSLLASIIKNVKNQSKNFKIGAETLSISHQGDYLLKTATITHLDNIERLDFKMIYDAYFSGIENIFNKRKLKAFNKIFGRISLVKNIDNNLGIQVDKFITKFNEHENKWNESVEQVRQFYDNLHNQTNGQTLPTRLADYLTAMDLVMFQWQNLENRTHYSILHEELITPLRSLNRTYQDLSITLNFNTLLLNSAHHFDNMERTLRVYSEIFFSYSNVYSSANKILSLSVQILSTNSILLAFLSAKRSFKRIFRKLKK